MIWFIVVIALVQFLVIGWLANSVAKWVWICEEQGRHLKAVNAVLHRHEVHFKIIGEVINRE